MARNLLELFENPKQQYDSLYKELIERLPFEVVEEIEAFVILKTEEKFNKIESIISPRFHQITIALERLNQSESKEEYLQGLQKIFTLIHPKSVLADLKQAFTFNEIRHDYETFLTTISTRYYGVVFKRYQWDEKTFAVLQQGLLYKSKDVMDSLRLHAQQMRNHFELLQSLKDTALIKTGVKIGSRLIGHAVAGIFGSLAARFITNTIFDDESAINDSLYQVGEKWDNYLAALYAFLDDLRLRYMHVLLSLYGGVFLHAQEDFKTLRLKIVWLSLKEHDL